MFIDIPVTSQKQLKEQLQQLKIKPGFPPLASTSFPDAFVDEAKFSLHVGAASVELLHDSVGSDVPILRLELQETKVTGD